MQICKNRYLLSKGYRAFGSKSNPTREPYRAYAFREMPELPMCTCMPFLTSRKKAAAEASAIEGRKVTTMEVMGKPCSHLKKVFAETCDWQQTTEGEYQWDQRCPKCGDEVVNTDDVDLPEDKDAQVDDLRILLEELQGTRAPVKELAPLPEADPELPTVPRKAGPANADDAAQALLGLMKTKKDA